MLGYGKRVRIRVVGLELCALGLRVRIIGYGINGLWLVLS